MKTKKTPEDDKRIKRLTRRYVRACQALDKLRADCAGDLGPSYKECDQALAQLKDELFTRHMVAIGREDLL